MTNGLRAIGAALIVVAAIALLRPRALEVIDSYSTSARERWGLKANPLQKTTLVVFSLMMVFFAITVVLPR